VTAFHSVVDRIHTWIDEAGDRLAVVDGSRRVTYAELAGAARGIQRSLRRTGVGPGARVGICADPSAAAIAAVVAVLEAGAACVPLDPSFPEERLRLMSGDAGLEAILADRRVRFAPPGLDPIPLASTSFGPASAPAPSPRIAPETIAYVLFTSGSTGRPKGVAMPHRSLANMVAWQDRALPVADDRVAQFAPLSFDVAFQEIVTTLAAGATLVVVPPGVRRDPEQLIDLIASEAITRLFLPFVALQSLATVVMRRPAASLRSLRDVVTAGEQLRTTEPITRMFRELRGARLHNHYGPTETHLVTAYTLPADVARWIPLPPIGRPIAQVSVYVATEDLELAPVGVPGEIYLAGDALAVGYHDRPELTAERFLPNPFEPDRGRVYRTGDLGWWSSDGLLHFLGRADDQVKVRGHRVELGEVEANLRLHPDVRDAVVVASAHDGRERRLVGCVVGDDRLDVAEIQSFLRRRLPEYMVPRALTRLDRLPLTPTGKVDRAGCARAAATAVRSPGSERPGAGAPVEPPGPAAGPLPDVVRIVGDVLERDDVHPAADFFTLGGHSLLAIALVSRIADELGVSVPLRTLFESASLEELAAWIADEHDPTQRPSLRASSSTRGRA
jgi:amino acid adenylation domain-containing protein